MVKLVPAKCPSCGANLELPEGREVAHCIHCGGKVIIDREVHVHGQTAIACPDCNGKGQMPCEIEEYKDDVPEIVHGKKSKSEWHNVRLITRYNVTPIAWIPNQWYFRATGCDGSGKCMVQWVSRSMSKLQGQVWEVGKHHFRQNFCKSGSCPRCEGKGKVGLIFKKNCSVCKGTGKCPFCNGTTKCSICGGDGIIQCKTCEGTGFKIYKGK